MDTAPQPALSPARAEEIRKHIKQVLIIVVLSPFFLLVIMSFYQVKPVSHLCTKFTSGNFIIRCRAVHAVAMLYQGGMNLGEDDISLLEFAIKECKKYVNDDLGSHPSAPMVVDTFLLLIQSLLQYDDAVECQSVALPTVFCRYPQNSSSHREKFIQMSPNGGKGISGIEVCIDTLHNGGSWFQIIYRALNIIWLCTLSSPSNPLLLSKPLAQILADLLKKEERKEKIIRMAVSIMINLSSQAKFLDMILPLGVLRSTQQNLLRVWSDPDIDEQLKVLLAKLQARVDGKGTWDEYRKEVLQGPLDWTPAHRSKQFWSDNVNRFGDNDFMVLKSLIVVLQSKLRFQIRP
jgi:hypothetical protein